MSASLKYADRQEMVDARNIPCGPHNRNRAQAGDGPGPGIPHGEKRTANTALLNANYRTFLERYTSCTQAVCFVKNSILIFL